MNNLDQIYASALAALPEIGSNGALPSDIQVFPPGKGVKFTLQDYPGQEFEIDSDPAAAEVLNRDLQDRLARARSGAASMPFADKNHDDAEKTFVPVRYFWGGDDKIKGGVRLVPEWVPFGADLVRARAFGYFSQNFLFSKAKKKVLGLINENVGGLVNRPGFSTQAAYARADDRQRFHITNIENDMTSADLSAINDIITAAIKPISEKVSALEVGRMGSSIPGQARATATLPPRDQNSFEDMVYAHAKSAGVTIEQALQQCTLSRPDLAEDYLQAMRVRRK